MSNKALALLTFLVGAIAASGQIVISELMFSVVPFADPEGTRDYIEIVNAGDASVDIGGWYFDDEDENATFIPDGTVVGPGEVLVVTDRDPGEFRTAWGLPNSVKVLDTDWKKDTNPTDGNSNIEAFAIDYIPTNDNPERLGLFKPNGELVDQVNYFNGRNGWTNVQDGQYPNPPSIYLPLSVIKAAAESGDPLYTDNATLWQVSVTGVDGVRPADNVAAGKGGNFFWMLKTEIGSPGYIEGLTTEIPIPEPAAAGLMFGFISLAAAVRRRRR